MVLSRIYIPTKDIFESIDKIWSLFPQFGNFKHLAYCPKVIIALWLNFAMQYYKMDASM